jgi:putative ABC transport system permease protein
MIMIKLALQSLRNRSVTAILTIAAIAVSVMLLLGVEKVRLGARQSFADTISGTDLIVGARTGSLQLLLYSVFRIGNATNNMTWPTYQDIQTRPEIRWSVPLSLGDSHRGFRVLSTTTDYFDRYRFRQGRNLVFAQGKPFHDLYDVVIGADVAVRLNYRLGDEITLGHGTGAVAFVEHTGKPFRIVGILAKTGTPVDRTLHTSLEANTAIHIGWESGVPQPGQEPTAADVAQVDLTPKTITAVLVGLKSRQQIFTVQRLINDYRAEPLSAIIPGAALQELWGLIGTAETALGIISAMVVGTALLGMITMILTTLNERRREMAILRSVGARPSTVIGLLVTEATLLTCAGVVAGTLALYAALFLSQPVIDRMYGLSLPVDPPSLQQLFTLLAIIGAGLLAGLVPAVIAYRQSLADGMTVNR